MAANTLDTYLDLITSEHRDKPKFVATVSVGVKLGVQIQNVLRSMIDIFDIDLAVGDQLDIIGEWVGVSRNVSIPITGVFFSFDGSNPNLGWDYGIWQDANAVSITQLPDSAYKTLLRAKIAANNWDGTTPGAYKIFANVFPNNTILIQDNGDMSYELALVGQVDSLTLALLTGGQIPLRPEGVRVNSYYVSPDGNPLFGFDSANSSLNGFDVASWAVELAPT